MLNEDASLPYDVLVSLPERQTVLNHAISVDGKRWREALSARGLPKLDGKLADSGRTTVSRQELFDLGDQPKTVDHAFQLLYYSLAWGLGLSGSRLTQRLDKLAEHHEKAGELLVSAWEVVGTESSLKEAYALLTTNRGAGRIPWFGPAFSSKFLYFAQGAVEKPRYLILDQVVARNLRQDAWPAAPTAAWWPDTYERYCNLMARWATEASEGGEPVRADQIEFALFHRE